MRSGRDSFMRPCAVIGAATPSAPLPELWGSPAKRSVACSTKSRSAVTRATMRWRHHFASRHQRRRDHLRGRPGQHACNRPAGAQVARGGLAGRRLNRRRRRGQQSRPRGAQDAVAVGLDERGSNSSSCRSRFNHKGRRGGWGPTTRTVANASAPCGSKGPSMSS